MTEHKKCAGHVSVPGMRLVYKSCDKRGSLEHKGKWWCKIHHPPTVAAKRKARNAAYDAELNAKWSAEQKKAEQAKRDAAYLATFRELAREAAYILDVHDRSLVEQCISIAQRLGKMHEEPNQ